MKIILLEGQIIEIDDAVKTVILRTVYGDRTLHYPDQIVINDTLDKTPQPVPAKDHLDKYLGKEALFIVEEDVAKKTITIKKIRDKK